MTERDVRVQYRPSVDQAEWLEDRLRRAMRRDSLAGRAKTEVDMWRAVLAGELDRQRWTMSEIGMIADVIAGSLLTDAVGVTVSHAAVELMGARVAAEGILTTKWGTDELAVLDRLSQLGPAADIALCDAVSRWWDLDLDHTPEGWAQVGLTVTAGDPK